MRGRFCSLPGPGASVLTMGCDSTQLSHSSVCCVQPAAPRRLPSILAIRCLYRLSCHLSEINTACQRFELPSSPNSSRALATVTARSKRSRKPEAVATNP